MKKSFSTETDLLKELIKGNEYAFKELYVQYKNQLIYFTLSYLKSKSYAEDIYQDAFTAIWLNRKNINPDLPFKPYLYTIIKNRVLNELYNLDKNRKLEVILKKKALPIDNKLEENILKKELGELLNEAINKLTPQQQYIFTLSRKQQLKHKEIASLLNISVNTVQEHISSSLKSIREYLTIYAKEYTDTLIILLVLGLL